MPVLWTSGERIRTGTWDQGHRTEPMNLGMDQGVWGPVEGPGELGPAMYQRQSVRGMSLKECSRVRMRTRSCER